MLSDPLIDRQQRFFGSDHSKIMESTVLLEADQADHYFVDALGKAFVMSCGGHIILSGPWVMKAHDLRETALAIGSTTIISVMEEKPSEAVAEAADVVVRINSGSAGAEPQKTQILGWNSGEQIGWFAGSRKITVRPVSPVSAQVNDYPLQQLLLAGVCLAEIYRALIPDFSQWRNSDMAGPVVFQNNHRIDFSEDIKHGFQDTSLVLAGCGAIGTWISYAWALGENSVSKFKDLVLIDPDHIELSNLARQVLFCQRDIGKPKAEVLAERLREALFNARIQPVVEKINDESFFDRHEIKPGLICCGTDNLKSRSLLNRMAVHHQIPFINAGTDPLSANCFSAVPGYPCLNCASDIEKRATSEDSFEVQSCAHVEPSVVSTNMIAAALVLMSLNRPFSDKLLYDVSYPRRIGVQHVQKRPDCFCHGF
jgi:molybdopterin/thiamine biosynthesis adenylyltransferase